MEELDLAIVDASGSLEEIDDNRDTLDADESEEELRDDEDLLGQLNQTSFILDERMFRKVPSICLLCFRAYKSYETLFLFFFRTKIGIVCSLPIWMERA